MQVYKYAMYTSMQYVIMQICNYANIQVCNQASIQVWSNNKKHKKYAFDIKAQKKNEYFFFKL